VLRAERDWRRHPVVLASGITEPLIHVADRLTQLTLIVIGGQQTLLHKSLSDLADGLRVKAAAPDRTLKNRQNPDQDPASALRTGFGTGTAGSVAMTQRCHGPTIWG
jgi:hypothetical protein